MNDYKTFNGNHILYNKHYRDQMTDRTVYTNVNKVKQKTIDQSCSITKEKVPRMCAEYGIEK